MSENSRYYNKDGSLSCGNLPAFATQIQISLVITVLLYIKTNLDNFGIYYNVLPDSHLVETNLIKINV